MARKTARVRFNDVLEQHQKEIYRYAFRMTGNADDAADLMQDTFLRAFRAFPRLGEDANHRAWLYRIAHRQALNLFRARKVRASEPLEHAHDLSDPADGPESMAETRRLADALSRVVEALSPRQRSALLLKKYEGLSYAEVAEVLGSTEENARAHVYQAMRKVRSGLAPESESQRTRISRGA